MVFIRNAAAAFGVGLINRRFSAGVEVDLMAVALKTAGAGLACGADL